MGMALFKVLTVIVYIYATSYVVVAGYSSRMCASLNWNQSGN